MTEEEYVNRKVIYRFKRLWSGWELDTTGEIIERENGTRAIILTNHGRPYLASEEELRDDLVKYRTALADTQTALDILK